MRLDFYPEDGGRKFLRNNFITAWYWNPDNNLNCHYSENVNFCGLYRFYRKLIFIARIATTGCAMTHGVPTSVLGRAAGFVTLKNKTAYRKMLLIRRSLTLKERLRRTTSLWWPADTRVVHRNCFEFEKCSRQSSYIYILSTYTSSVP